MEKNSNPTTSYLMKGKGGGTSSVVKGGSKGNLVGGAKDSQKEIVGGKRWDIGGRRMSGGRKM